MGEYSIQKPTCSTKTQKVLRLSGCFQESKYSAFLKHLKKKNPHKQKTNKKAPTKTQKHILQGDTPPNPKQQKNTKEAKKNKVQKHFSVVSALLWQGTDHRV